MNKTKTILWVVIVIVVIAGGWYGLIKKQTPVTEKEPIKIGVMVPLTGDAAVYGEASLNVLQIALNEINNAGGINGRKLEYIIEDSKCNGKDGATSAQKLVNIDKVQVIIGGICSSETISAVPIASTAKVVIVSPTASSPALTGISKYFFRTHPSDATQGKVLAELAYKKGWRNIGFISEQTDFVKGNYESFKKVFEDLGGKVLVNEEFQTGVLDFRSQLTKLKAANIDALFLAPQTTASGEHILKQMKNLGWAPNLLLLDTISSNPKFVQDHKDQLEGAYAAEFGVNPNNPKMKGLIDAYKKNYNVDMPYQTYMQDVYDAVYLIRDGILAVGYNGEKIAEWSKNIKNWDGASGKVTIDVNGDRVGGHEPRIVKNGELTQYTE